MTWRARDMVALPIKAYRLVLSPWLGSQCRFTPSCSVYALQALEHHGAVKGLGLTGWRIMRCHPWCQGGHDPVPGTGTSKPASQNTSSSPPSVNGSRT